MYWTGGGLFSGRGRARTCQTFLPPYRSSEVLPYAKRDGWTGRTVWVRFFFYSSSIRGLFFFLLGVEDYLTHAEVGIPTISRKILSTVLMLMLVWHFVHSFVHSLYFLFHCLIPLLFISFSFFFLRVDFLFYPNTKFPFFEFLSILLRWHTWILFCFVFVQIKWT